MKRIIRLLFPLFWGIPCWAQVAVTPIVQPHVSFVNGSGNPCAGCKLSTFAAGTTTPMATYTDASGTTQNANPIVLDAAGGANIWMGLNSYKLILKDASGATIWSVDQVNSVRLCAAAGAVQAANTAGNGITCDPNITINTVTHTLSIGSLPTNHVTIGALGTPTMWTFDTTTPATALASLGGGAGSGTVLAGTTNQLAFYASNGSTVQGTSSIPNGITAITRGPTDNSTNIATTAYVAFPGVISPTVIGINGGVALSDNQGNGIKVQHSAGTTTTDNCTKFDSGGNTVDAGFSCLGAAPIPTTQNDLTGFRSFGVSYQNTAASAIYVSGYGSTSGGSTGRLSCLNGPSFPTNTVWANEVTATVSSAPVAFTCLIPAGYFYEVIVSGAVSGPTKWFETSF